MFSKEMIEAVVLMGSLGLLIGVALAAASKIFYVYVDPLVLAIDDALPGANCGGCGMPGCSANAEAIVAGKAAPNSCVAGGADLAETIAGLLGVTVEAKEPDFAAPGCTYGLEEAETKYTYQGLDDCRALALLSGGIKVCNIGCIGLGTCAKACPFGALEIGPRGLPVVDEEKCTGCGTCEKVCPKNIIHLTSVTRRIMREYTTDNCTTPCQRSCPAGIDIREYIRQIALGDYLKAVQVIKERNPFPTVIGRICPRPCETDCRRQYVDEPVAINFLKRFAADYEREQGQHVLPYKAPATNRKIALIGGGVEGMSAAFFASRLGHSPTVFEATERLGGLLNSAIAKYRLPDEILAWDIAGILEMGVVAETGKALGRDMSITSLLSENFEAVFLAAGGWDSRLARGAGGQLESIIPDSYLLIDLIKNASDKITCGPETIIAGGGPLLLDAVKQCRQMGAQNFTVLLREAQTPKTAADIQLAALEAEGVQVIFNAGIHQLQGKGDHLEGVEYTDLFSNSRQQKPANTLILAAGRFPEMIFVKPKDNADNGNEAQPPADQIPWVGIEVYKKPAFHEEVGLMARGDDLSDMDAAIKAIAAGRRAAVSIHQVIYDIPLSLPDNVVKPTTNVQNVFKLEHVKSSNRSIMPTATQQELAQGVEIEKGFDEHTARKEAGRCLQCGLICYRSTLNMKAVGETESAS